MGLKGQLGTLACLATMIAMLAGASPAPAHQTATNRGVSVTMHVTQDDEPVAGQPSRVIVTRVRAGSYRFRWSRCVCYLRITDSSGNVILDRRQRGRSTPVTFPRATAYQIVFSGRVKRGGRKKRFRVSYAIRAS